MTIEHPDGEYESEEESEYFETIERPPQRDSFLRFKSSRDDIYKSVLSIFDTISRSLNSLARVEHRIGSIKLIQKMDLLNITLDDHDVKVMRQRLEEILTSSLKPLNHFFLAIMTLIF